MRVFVTGATGFIGSAVVKDLIAGGHQVLGLCRSPDKAAALSAAGAEVYPGSLEDLVSLEQGAASADGIIHLAFNHDFSRFKANCEDDRRVIQVLGAAIAGSSKPLLITSGTGMANTAPGRPATESSAVVSSEVIPRAASEEAAAVLISSGVNVSVVRLPQVHDQVRQGLVTYAIAIAREKGVCAYVEDGRTAGRRRIGTTWQCCTGWRSRRPSPVRSIMRSRRKASRTGPWPRRLVIACSFRSNQSLPRKLRLISVGSPCSYRTTCPRPVSRPARCWAGTRRGRG